MRICEFSEEFTKSVQSLYGQDVILYGPYKSVKDGRKRVVIQYNNNSKKTRQYAKLLLEVSLGRLLEKHETVDHIDENYENDNINNLQVLTRSENITKSVRTKPAKIGNFICSICKCSFYKYLRYVKHNQETLKKAGPFCSKRCAGIYSTNIQFNKVSAHVSQSVEE